MEKDKYEKGSTWQDEDRKIPADRQFRIKTR
jgi:hypothetical protein